MCFLRSCNRMSFVSQSVIQAIINLHPISDFCLIEHFNPKCGMNEIIVMIEAKFGRMKLSRCLYEDRRELGCHDNILELFDDMCFGKQSCDILVGANDMGSASTCSKGLLQYLEADYSCRKGMLESVVHISDKTKNK